MTAHTRAQFDRIVLPRLDEAYRLARWLTGNQTDAEDVVQEACLRAFAAIGNFTEGNARAWFLTIVRDTCYSWLDRHRPRAVVSSEALESSERDRLEVGGLGVEAPPTPERALIDKQDAERLGRMIDTLPLQLKEALVLRENHDMTYRESAEVSRVPIDTVMSRLARARQHVISVTAVPTTASLTQGETHREGSTLETWTAGSLTYWAVSDLNVRDLRTFVGLFRAATAPT